MQNPLSVCAKCISIELIHSSFVMPALVAGIDVLLLARKTWMPGTADKFTQSAQARLRCRA